MDFGMIGAGIVMGIAAMGSAIGIGIAGQGAIGAWKRCYLNNKPAPFRWEDCGNLDKLTTSRHLLFPFGSRFS